MRCLLGFSLAAASLSVSPAAHADSYAIQTNVLLSGTPADADLDTVQLFNFANPFLPAYHTFMLQPGIFTEGFNPVFIIDPILGPIDISPYQPGTGSFVALEDITITDYSSTFQVLDTTQRFVTLSGSVTADPFGNRIVNYAGQDVSFGNGIDLLILPYVSQYTEYESGAPFNLNAVLIVTPTVGSPAPATTPEPSGLLLLTSGALGVLSAVCRTRRLPLA